MVIASDGGYDMVADELQNSNTGFELLDDTRHALGEGMDTWSGIANQAGALWDSWWEED